MEPAAQARFDALRAAHFPPERNFLTAHLTLFHALPGEEESTVAETLRSLVARTAPPALRFPSLRFLGRGVAVEVESPALLAVRAELAAAWQGWLGAQDRQKWRPHVTIQNKVAPETARALHARLAAEWVPFAAAGASLGLWRYRGGPWEAAGAFPFTGPPAAADAGAPARLPAG